MLRDANAIAAQRKNARGEELRRLWRAEQRLRQIIRMKAALEENGAKESPRSSLLDEHDEW